MAAAVIKFLIVRIFMCVAPLAILYGFNHNLVPGFTNLSPHVMIMVSGFLAMISVNAVTAFYIYIALKDPPEKHEPNPKFLADAKASITQKIGEANTFSKILEERRFRTSNMLERMDNWVFDQCFRDKSSILSIFCRYYR